MSAPTTDYTDLLQEAIKQAKVNATRAVEDIVRLASKAAVAVTSVTNGQALLERVPIKHAGVSNVYQLQLRKAGSKAPPSDLGIYAVTQPGYPVLHWLSRDNWGDPEMHYPDGEREFTTEEELDEHFRLLVSDPKSRLVILVTFFQQ